MNNPYEHAARYEKARRLADTLHAWDIGSDAAKGLTDAQWAAVAQAAGVPAQRNDTIRRDQHDDRSRSEATTSLGVEEDRMNDITIGVHVHMASRPEARVTVTIPPSQQAETKWLIVTAGDVNIFVTPSQANALRDELTVVLESIA